MGVFMTEEEINQSLANAADSGCIAETGWRGFSVVGEKEHWSQDQRKAMRWAYWVGARTVFDALDRMMANEIDPQLYIERFAKLRTELGDDLFCRPPTEVKPS